MYPQKCVFNRSKVNILTSIYKSKKFFPINRDYHVITKRFLKTFLDMSRKKAFYDTRIVGVIMHFLKIAMLLFSYKLAACALFQSLYRKPGLIFKSVIQQNCDHVKSYEYRKCIFEIHVTRSGFPSARISKL